MYYVDLNSDLGELWKLYHRHGPGDLKVCVLRQCGLRLASPEIPWSWQRLWPWPGNTKTAVGAHPGFPDLMGFGRRNMNVTPEEAKAYVKYQLGALMAFYRGAWE